jgi:nucleoside-diphosphate-sugar epimerase
MAVLITGGTGFVGLNLAEALLNAGVDVVLFDLGAPPPAFGAAVGARAAGMRCIIGDVRKPRDIERAFDENDVTHVFHGAVVTAGKARESSDPQSVVDVNLNGTLNMMRVAQARKVRRVVYPSSIGVYGRSLFDRERITEDGTPVVPENLYGITKFAAEGLALRLGSLWGLDVVVARIGNTFGPWERDTGVRDLLTPFAQIGSAACRGMEVLLPDVRLKRDMVYSRDLAAALALLLHLPQLRFRHYNLAVDADWSDIYTRWCRRLEATFQDFRWRVAQPGEAANVDYHDSRDRARCDSTRALEDLQWKPTFLPDRALEDYADWLRQNVTYLRQSR